ncbi:aryl-alcohol dehydrogenase AAD14 [Diaporthe helianthi]|uniref:Aryl-alcohol dehydrogenase AAD14 n=1 Tax=Diaporthe helianthi TaxID=158607 RepID=A0A2P5HF14_DIAHE|nr:aryl-alcohol dehydrogenase AAD14 [Diaporthe helianthi]
MSSHLQPIPEPQTELGRYRVLSSSAGVKVSPLVLGAMSLGKAWGAFTGAVDEEEAFKFLDAFVDAATKYTNAFQSHELGPGRSAIFGGNNKKSLFLSVEASLRKLQTTYIDLLYVHWWDWSTSIEELMDSLHILVEQGKVLYLGISDTPAWVVAAANTYARAHGKTPFSVYQGRWSVLDRDFERDILPMARHFGLALCPWNVMGGGGLKTKKQIEARQSSNEGGRFKQQSEAARKVSVALEKVASEHGVDSIQQIALAYVLRKARNVFPLVGFRKVEHLHDSIQALSIRLTDDQVSYIESQNPFDIGFPLNFVGDNPRETGGYNNLAESLLAAKVSFEKPPKPAGYE